MRLANSRTTCQPNIIHSENLELIFNIRTVMGFLNYDIRICDFHIDIVLYVFFLLNFFTNNTFDTVKTAFLQYRNFCDLYI